MIFDTLCAILPYELGTFTFIALYLHQLKLVNGVLHS